MSTKLTNGTLPRLRREALLVLGMHRSGTSAMAGVLVRLGAAVPETLMAPNEANPRGYWESVEVCRFNDQLLSEIGSEWADPREIDPQVVHEAVQRLHHRFRALLDQEFGDARLMCIKDPRNCRLLPFWLPALARCGIDAKAVIPVRGAWEVARSLEVRDGLAPQQSQLLWLRHNVEAEFQTRKMPRAFVRYEELLADWRAVTRRIAQQTGIVWPRSYEAVGSGIDAFLEPELRHHHAGVEAMGRVEEPIGGWLASTEEALGWLAAGRKPKAAMRALDGVRLALNDWQRAAR